MMKGRTYRRLAECSIKHAGQPSNQRPRIGRRFALGRGSMAMSLADICVIFNPRSGRDRARQRMRKLHELLGARAVFRPTERPGHGEELALEAAKQGFATVAAAGGDGTVHEVANGILRARRPEVVLEIYPVGSANDYAHTLGLDPEWRLRADP